MPLHDPFPAYNAASNHEAHFVRIALVEAGIEAAVVEDVSQVGVWLGGLIPEIHKPQVWIERADADRAAPILAAYERRAIQLRRPEPNGAPVETVCEDCGMSATFPASQAGSVQSCPHCGAYVDVGGDSGFEGWDFGDADDSTTR